MARPGATLVLSFLAALLLGTLAAPQLLAQTAPVEMYRGRQGPYELALSILPETPVVGLVHFVVTLNDAESGQPVTDAELLVVVDDAEGKPTYQSLALNSPADRLGYQANFTFERAGEWTVRVRVTEKERGQAEFSVPLTVGDVALGPGLAGTYIWLLVVVVLVGGAFLIFRSARRRRP